MTLQLRRSEFYIIAALGITSLVFNMLMAWFVTERLPHLEDEIAYLFQARVFAHGELYAPPPKAERAFFIPFVVTVNDHRMGKYSIGWPMVLAVGELISAGWLVNPILGALTVILTYMLGRDIFNRTIGVVAAILTLSSPLFMLQSATYMSHPLAGLCATLMMWALYKIDLGRQEGHFSARWAVIAGAALGLLVLTRAFSAVAVALPFILLALWRIVRAGDKRRELLKLSVSFGLTAILISLLQPLWLFLTTGDPLINLYTLVWKYDRVGFGPEFGRSGHTIEKGWRAAKVGLILWASDSFGWPYASWVPALPALILGFNQVKPGLRIWNLLLALPFVMLVVFHMAYWVGAEVYGPRYYYEGITGFAIVTAVGLYAAATSMASSFRRLQSHPYAISITLSILMVFLIGLTWLVYLPYRIPEWSQLYGISRQPLDELESLRQTDRVLVLVRSGHWRDYGEFIFLNSPWYDGPIVAAHDYNPQMADSVIEAYPGREIWYYNGIFSHEPSSYSNSP